MISGLLLLTGMSSIVDYPHILRVVRNLKHVKYRKFDVQS